MLLSGYRKTGFGDDDLLQPNKQAMISPMFSWWAGTNAFILLCFPLTKAGEFIEKVCSESVAVEATYTEKDICQMDS